MASRLATSDMHHDHDNVATDVESGSARVVRNRQEAEEQKPQASRRTEGTTEGAWASSRRPPPASEW